MASKASSSFEDDVAVEDLEKSPLTGEDAPFLARSRRAQWFANDSVIWKYWALSATIISLLMMGNIIFSARGGKDTAAKPALDTTSPSSLASLRNNEHVRETWSPEHLVETQYFRDLRYMTLDHDADYLWQEHLVMSTGNIRLPDGNGSSSLMGISMYHQMHCLAKMRLALQEAREGVDIGTGWQDDAHWPHCLDYLRSSIMCFADGTLEKVTSQPGPVTGTFVEVIDGSVETRYCRDTQPLYELERQYGPNSHYADEDGGVFEVAPGR